MADGSAFLNSDAAGIESAQALLGVVLLDHTRLREAAHVRPDHFAEPLHGRLWAAIVDLVAADRRPDVRTLADRFASDPALQELGGIAYLGALFDKCGAPFLARQHAEQVVEAHTRRIGSVILTDAARALRDPSYPAASIMGEVREALGRLEQDVAPDDDLVTADAAVGELLDALEREAEQGFERGAMTGLRCFDRRLRGLRPGWLVVIGGRPSMAKSGLMRSAAYGCAQRNPQSAVIMFSLEMDRREVAERALSAASFMAGDGIPYSDFGAKLSPHDRMTLAGLRRRMPANVLIDDRSSISLDDIRRRVWAVKAKRPVAAIFVDYLQLMARPPSGGRNETLLLGDITRGLKTLAREAECCVVLLSQLNRLVESRDDKRPQLADLRDSGSIEADANAVLFPFREVYYLERAEPKELCSAAHSTWQQDVEIVRRRMDVIAAKVRGGAIGTDRQTYFAEFDHVEDVVE